MRRERWTSRPCTAKSAPIKSAKRRHGGCVLKAIELTSGDLCGVSESRLRGPRGPLTAAQKSAEGVVGAVAKVTEGPNGPLARGELERLGGGPTHERGA